MAVVNASDESILIEIRDVGMQSDGGVFEASKLRFAMDSDLLPKARVLLWTDKIKACLWD